MNRTAFATCSSTWSLAFSFHKVKNDGMPYQVDDDLREANWIGEDVNVRTQGLEGRAESELESDSLRSALCQEHVERRSSRPDDGEGDGGDAVAVRSNLREPLRKRGRQPRASSS